MVGRLPFKGIVEQKKLLGQRSVRAKKVYVPACGRAPPMVC